MLKIAAHHHSFLLLDQCFSFNKLLAERRNKTFVFSETVRIRTECCSIYLPLQFIFTLIEKNMEKRGHSHRCLSFTSFTCVFLISLIWISENVMGERCFSDLEEDLLCHPSDTISSHISMKDCCAMKDAKAYSATDDLDPHTAYFRCKKCEIAIDGGWGEWGPYGACKTPCGRGMKYRQRECNNPEPSMGGKPCPFQTSLWFEALACEDKPCPTSQSTEKQTVSIPTRSSSAYWGEWQKTDNCSASCGHGLQRQVRKCMWNGKPVENKPVDRYRCVGASILYSSCFVNCSEGNSSTGTPGAVTREDVEDGDHLLTYIAIAVAGLLLILIIVGIIVYCNGKHLLPKKNSYENQEAVFTYKKIAPSTLKGKNNCEQVQSSITPQCRSFCNDDYEVPRAVDRESHVYEEF